METKVFSIFACVSSDDLRTILQISGEPYDNQIIVFTEFRNLLSVDLRRNTEHFLSLLCKMSKCTVYIYITARTRNVCNDRIISLLW